MTGRGLTRETMYVMTHVRSSPNFLPFFKQQFPPEVTIFAFTIT